MIACPECRIPMAEVTARADPGTLIQLDQCRKCGGIWCDKWELLPIDPEEAERIDGVDAPLLAAVVLLAGKSLHCPRCTAPLAACSDPALPADLRLRRCFRCEGIWLNRGQFRRYKRHQHRTRVARLGADGVIRKVPEVYADPKAWTLKGTKGMLAYPQMTDDDLAQAAAGNDGTIRSILRALLRLAVGL